MQQQRVSQALPATLRIRNRVHRLNKGIVIDNGYVFHELKYSSPKGIPPICVRAFTEGKAMQTMRKELKNLSQMPSLIININKSDGFSRVITTKPRTRK